MNEFFKKFTKMYVDAIKQDIDFNDLSMTIDLIEDCAKSKGKLIFAGNGGSAAMASHVAVDFTKNAGIRSINFNEADLITCFANDFGYENWVKEALNFYADENDLVFLISSSGNSMNMVNAAKFCERKKINFVTLTGFSKNNNLSLHGNIKFWVDSKEYNIVEMTHHIILLLLVDYVINNN
tara:strand:- start:2438 stop:2980 length:543 start_codon:yes stop_codon:yes gene_type:complete